VDDAIVVVENVERVMSEEGLSPREATRKSMDQITGALVGIGMVLSAVFVPMAFLGGSTGVIYRQFSATIVSAMALSVLVAIVLTPALCATMLKPVEKGHHASDRGFFGWFNRTFDQGNKTYQRAVAGILSRRKRFLLVFAVNFLVAAIQQSRREQFRERLQEEQRLLQKERARASAEHRDLYELAAESAAQVGDSKPLKERIGIFLEQTGTKLRIGQVLAISLAAGVVAAVAVYVATASLVLVTVAGLAGGAVPVIWVQVLRTRRLNKLLSQLSDAFDLMARTMRAGQTFSQAIQSVAEEAAAPLSLEFAYCYDQQYLGMSTEASLRDLARRTGLLEIKIFVVAVLVHRQTGGNLSELLERLARVIRERYRIAGLLQSLTAEGRLQAYILLAMPVLLFAVLYSLNPNYAGTLLRFPILLLMTAGFMTAGALWMRKIIRFDY